MLIYYLINYYSTLFTGFFLLFQQKMTLKQYSDVLSGKFETNYDSLTEDDASIQSGSNSYNNNNNNNSLLPLINKQQRRRFNSETTTDFDTKKLQRGSSFLNINSTKTNNLRRNLKLSLQLLNNTPETHLLINKNSIKCRRKSLKTPMASSMTSITSRSSSGIETTDSSTIISNNNQQSINISNSGSSAASSLGNFI